MRDPAHRDVPGLQPGRRQCPWLGGRTIGTRFHFSDERRTFVYEMNDLLDRQLASAEGN